MMKGFVDWLRGPDAAELFRQRGMMLVADGPPAPEPALEDEAPPPDAIPGAVVVPGPER